MKNNYSINEFLGLDYINIMHTCKHDETEKGRIIFCIKLEMQSAMHPTVTTDTPTAAGG
jgi:hypothetical protein